MEELAKLMPEELKAKLSHYGLGKSAAVMYDVKQLDEHTISRIIGEKLASRRKVWSDILTGLVAMRDIDND